MSPTARGKRVRNYNPNKNGVTGQKTLKYRDRWLKKAKGLQCPGGLREYQRCAQAEYVVIPTVKIVNHFHCQNNHLLPSRN